MNKRGLRALVFWMVLVFGGLACTVGFGWKPLLGLDLQGGLSATLTPKKGTTPTTESVQEAASDHPPAGRRPRHRGAIGGPLRAHRRSSSSPD